MDKFFGLSRAESLGPGIWGIRLPWGADYVQGGGQDLIAGLGHRDSPSHVSLKRSIMNCTSNLPMTTLGCE